MRHRIDVLPDARTPAPPRRVASMKPSTRIRWLAALAALVIVPAVAASVEASTPAPAAKVPLLTWSDCGDGLQCATASVPLDYDRPQGTHISLALARRPATDLQHRIGTLFVNNGGPGNSVIDFMRIEVTN